MPFHILSTRNAYPSLHQPPHLAILRQSLSSRWAALLHHSGNEGTTLDGNFSGQKIQQLPLAFSVKMVVLARFTMIYYVSPQISETARHHFKPHLAVGFISANCSTTSTHLSRRSFNSSLSTTCWALGKVLRSLPQKSVSLQISWSLAA